MWNGANQSKQLNQNSTIYKYIYCIANKGYDLQSSSTWDTIDTIQPKFTLHTTLLLCRSFLCEI